MSYVTLNPRVSLQPTTLRLEGTILNTAIIITLLLMARHRPHTQVLLDLMTESHQDIPVMVGKKMICRRLVIMKKRLHRGREISVIRFVSKPIAPDSRAT